MECLSNNYFFFALFLFQIFFNPSSQLLAFVCSSILTPLFYADSDFNSSRRQLWSLNMRYCHYKWIIQMLFTSLSLKGQ